MQDFPLQICTISAFLDIDLILGLDLGCVEAKERFCSWLQRGQAKDHTSVKFPSLKMKQSSIAKELLFSIIAFIADVLFFFSQSTPDLIILFGAYGHQCLQG